MTFSLKREGFDNNYWYKERLDDDHGDFHDKELADVSDMPSLEGDEGEVKKGCELKILTSKKLLTRIPVLFAQIKAGNNFKKLKNETRQTLYLLYQDFTKKLCNNLIKSL